MSASIVVPSMGGVDRLPHLLASAERQTYRDFEMIVVLDGDIDGSEAMLSTLATSFPLRVITFAENRGRPAALNAGFHAARGEIFIRADDDLELESDFVEHHVRLHQDGPVGVVGICHNFFPDIPYARAYGNRANQRIRTTSMALPENLAWMRWSGNVSVSAEDFARVGDYDESFRDYGWEDVEWGYRLHLAGVPIVIDETFETLHHGPVTSTVARAERAFASGAAKRRFMRKHGASAIPAEERTAGGGRTPWNRAVGAASRVLTSQGRVARAGELVDRVLPRCSDWVGEKAVALIVESAAEAGLRAAVTREFSAPGRQRDPVKTPKSINASASR